HRGLVAAGDALRGPDGELPVRRRLPAVVLAPGDVQALADAAEGLLRSVDGARRADADLDDLLPHRTAVEHDVEAGHGRHVRRVQLEQLADLLERLLGEPPLLRLG